MKLVDVRDSDVVVVVVAVDIGPVAKSIGLAPGSFPQGLAETMATAMGALLLVRLVGRLWWL